MGTGNAQKLKREPDLAGDQRFTFDVPEFAKAFGISKGAAYSAVKRKEIPSIVIGRRILIPKAALEALLAQAGR
jgi:excisionase family DNA binding protein